YKKPVGDGVVLKSGDISVTEKEMVSGIEMEIFEQEEKLFNLKMEKLKSMLLNKLIESDPNKKNLSVEQFIEKNISNNIKVSKADIEKFIKEKNIPAEHVNDTIKKELKLFLCKIRKRVL
ncbi:hypothetical protein N9N67_08995, partial [Bacteriovoracaceae bacterium]|nr:hypothetical protein [Bacteriovoracaceae bacterium]